MAEIVIVGEAPGRNEMREGRPFIGASGKLFNKVAQEVGFPIDEGSVFVTNALRCIPRNSPPKAQEIHACQTRLFQEIGQSDRRLILCLGASALRAVTDRMGAKITRERGVVFESDFGPALATFHPAAILRGGQNYPTFLEDIRYAAEIVNSDGKAIRDPGVPDYTIVTDANVADVITELGLHYYLAADIETDGFNYFTDDVLCLGVSGEKNRVFIFPRDMIHHITKLLNPFHKWIWHNGKFDTSFLKFNLGLPAQVDEDTMLLHYALDERRGTHDLKQLSTSFLGATDYESTLKQYLPNKNTPYSAIPDDILWKYLAYDVDNTYQLYHLLKPQVADNRKLNVLYNRILIPASAFLQRVENNGMPIDLDYLSELSDILEERQIGAFQAVMKVINDVWDPDVYSADMNTASTPKEFNPGSSKQVKWLLYHPHAFGMRVPKGYEMNTREDTLDHLPPHPAIDAILDYRGVTKAKGTYVDGIIDRVLDFPDMRVHPTYLLHGTATGRLSSRDPNGQNFPRDAEIRDEVAVEEGKALIEADYSQAELRVLAILSHDVELMRIYNEGLDLHDEVAKDFFPNWEHETDYVLKREQRIRAKFVNFGIAYGRSASSIAKEFGITVAEAQRYIDRWYLRMSGAKTYLDRCRRIARAGGTLTTPFGRHRRFGLITKENMYNAQNEAANFTIQSTASDLTLLSAMEMEDSLTPLGAKIINLVHDSILIELPDDLVVIRAITDIVVQTMMSIPRNILKSPIPFVADTKVGYRWGSLKEDYDDFLAIRDERVNAL